MTTKRIKLPQRSKAPGELRYKLFRCGLCEDVTSSDGALRAGSSAFENSQATFAGVDQLRAWPHSGRETLVNPTRSEPRSTASRRQLSSNSAKLTTEHDHSNSMASPDAITAVWNVAPVALPRLRPPNHQPGLRKALTRLKQSFSALVSSNSAARVGVAAASVAAASAATSARAAAAAVVVTTVVAARIRRRQSQRAD